MQGEGLLKGYVRGGGDTQQIATGGGADLLGYPPFLFSYKLLFITDQCIDVLSLYVRVTYLCGQSC